MSWRSEGATALVWPAFIISPQCSPSRFIYRKLALRVAWNRRLAADNSGHIVSCDSYRSAHARAPSMTRMPWAEMTACPADDACSAELEWEIRCPYWREVSEWSNFERSRRIRNWGISFVSLIVEGAPTLKYLERQWRWRIEWSQMAKCIFRHLWITSRRLLYKYQKWDEDHASAFCHERELLLVEPMLDKSMASY